MTYHAGQVLNVGFTDGQVAMPESRTATCGRRRRPRRGWCIYVRATGLLPGDESSWN
jgi:prepilin-type processing-associated H-X9-DG protein